MKAICCRRDDNGKSSDASSIGKCGSSEIWPPRVRTPSPLVHTPPSLITSSSSDDCLSVSTTLGGISNLSASCIASKWLHIIDEFHHDDLYSVYLNQSIDVSVANCDYVRIKNKKVRCFSN